MPINIISIVAAKRSCPAVQALQAAKSVASDNRRFAALLSGAMGVSDYWADLVAEIDLTQYPAEFQEFATKMQLLREDMRLVEEDLIADAETAATWATLSLPAVEELDCAQDAAENDGTCTLAACG